MVCSKPCWLVCPALLLLLLWRWLVLLLLLWLLGLLLWGEILVIPLWRRICFSSLAEDGVKILIEILLKICSLWIVWVVGSPKSSLADRLTSRRSWCSRRGLRLNARQDRVATRR